MDFWGDNETMAKLQRHLGCADAWEVCHKLHIDHVVTVKPAFIGPPVDADHDYFGCGFRCVQCYPFTFTPNV